LQRPVTTIAGDVVGPHLTSCRTAHNERFPVCAAQVAQVQQTDRMLWSSNGRLVL
jgi:hypothetical protein